ncbi:thioredoxin family protein [Rhodocyclus tenuis]|uniref:thioredoxin family protein n=1 Tax=Rhodocyclus tenuis TaxID=1066 RepID=UPI001903C5EC|nr:thioredoxin fold domain-containing protein [Rhodocyclus tenuis]MBK1679016.1 hypothetical protein [Rhodocyclus tenuis]
MEIPFQWSFPRRLHALAVLFLGLCLSVAVHAEIFSERTEDLAQQVKLATGQGKQLAVLFEQDGCDACARLRRNVFSDKAAAKRFASTFRTVSVDLGREDGRVVTPDGSPQPLREWAARLRVPGTPALLFFDRDGHILYRHVGPLTDGEALRLLARYVVSGEFENQPFASFLASHRSAAAAKHSLQGDICRTRS